MKLDKLTKMMACITILFACLVCSVYGDITITMLSGLDGQTKQQRAIELVKEIMGDGVEFRDVSCTAYESYGVASTTETSSGIFKFTDDFPISIKQGIVLCTGSVDDIKCENSTDSITSHPPIQSTVLRFNFIPDSTEVRFNYVFASDEYNEFAPSFFNDKFEFNVEGVEGTVYPKTNVALLPDGETAVTINNVRNGNNEEYYIDNDPSPMTSNYNPHYFEYDGFTVDLTAEIKNLEINGVYSFELIIEDVGDRKYDSAVFIKSNSFSTKKIYDLQESVVSSQDILFSSSTNGSLLNLRKAPMVAGALNFASSDSIRELEMFNNQFYMTLGKNLFRPAFSVPSVDIVCDSQDLIFSNSDDDDIISMLSTGSMLVVGTGTEATESQFDEGNLSLLVSTNGTSFTDESGGLEGSGVQCLLESGSKRYPNIELKVIAEVEFADGEFVSEDDWESEDKVSPDLDSRDQIRYTINYDFSDNSDLGNVEMYAILPAHTKTGHDYVTVVDTFSSVGGYGIYDPVGHQMIWDLPADSVGSAVITLTADESALPGEYLEIPCWIENDTYAQSVSNDLVQVECWGDGIVFVNSANKNGIKNGISWETAFDNLTDALDFIVNSECGHDEIWIAAGTYFPRNESQSFVIPDGVAVY